MAAVETSPYLVNVNDAPILTNLVNADSTLRVDSDSIFNNFLITGRLFDSNSWSKHVDDLEKTYIVKFKQQLNILVYNAINKYLLMIGIRNLRENAGFLTEEQNRQLEKLNGELNKYSKAMDGWVNYMTDLILAMRNKIFEYNTAFTTAVVPISMKLKTPVQKNKPFKQLATHQAVKKGLTNLTFKSDKLNADFFKVYNEWKNAISQLQALRFMQSKNPNDVYDFKNLLRILESDSENLTESITRIQAVYAKSIMKNPTELKFSSTLGIDPIKIETDTVEKSSIMKKLDEFLKQTTKISPAALVSEMEESFLYTANSKMLYDNIVAEFAKDEYNTVLNMDLYRERLGRLKDTAVPSRRHVELLTEATGGMEFEVIPRLEKILANMNPEDKLIYGQQFRNILQKARASFRESNNQYIPGTLAQN